MTGTKTVAERLREITYDHVDCPADVATLAIGSGAIDCAKPCPDCTRKYLDKLADAIEAEQAQAVSKALIEEAAKQENMDSVLLYNAAKDLQENAHIIKESVLNDLAHYSGLIRKALKGAKPQLPEGVIWPTYEDGELVKFGDEYVAYTGEVRTVEGVSFRGGETFVNGISRDKPMKRPETEVLDADGVPIKVGDTVLDISGEKEGVVERVGELNTRYGYRNVAVLWPGYTAPYLEQSDQLTHRKPDTLESIFSEMVSVIESGGCVDLAPYVERYRKLKGDE